MILDLNITVGRWPFAPLRYESADDMLRLMDAAGIDRAVLTSLDSVFYYDCQIGNREVGAICRQHADRFVPFAVINPNMPRWREHLCECLNEFGAQGVKLHPDFHKYALVPAMGREDVEELMAQSAEARLPVYIQTSLLDMRHYPGYCLVPEVPILKVAEAIERYSDNTFIVGGARWFASAARELARYATGMNLPDFFVATDGLGGPWDGIGGLVEQIGSEHVLFSSRTPLLYSEASKWMIETSGLSKEDEVRILGQNAAKLLGLEGE